MRALVAYASRHGATAGIAERIAARLTEAGIETDVRPANEVHDVERYDVFVIGSGAYMHHWLKEATSFTRRHRKVLAKRPVWLFSSGPLGTNLVDDHGRDIFEAARPKEFDEFGSLSPRAEKVFFGSWDPEAPPVGIAERMSQRLFKMAPAATEGLPAGDFRDWPAIDAWAAEIAAELHSTDRSVIV
jgi:menaquinone-dependent protoporphyrinogen oxidase